MTPKREASEALGFLIFWTVFVACVTLLGIGFAGGVRNLVPETLLFVASPVIPYLIWRRLRREARKPVEKPE